MLPHHLHHEANDRAHRCRASDLAAVHQRNGPRRKHFGREPHQRGLRIAQIARQYRQPQPIHRGGKHRRAFVAVKNDRRSGRMLFKPLGGGHAGKARTVADHVVPAQIGGVRIRRPARKVTARGIKRPAQLAQLARDQIRVGNRPDAQGQIGFTALEVDCARSAQQFQRQLRMLISQLREARRQQVREARRHRQPHALDLQRGELEHREHAAFEVLDHRCHSFAERRQREPFGPAHDQCSAQRVLERRQTTADGRVLHTHGARGAGQRLRLRGPQEVAQVVPVQLLSGRHAATLHRGSASRPQATRASVSAGATLCRAVATPAAA